MQNQPSQLESSAAIHLLTDASRARLRRATPTDAPAVRDLTRAAYAKWVPVLGREAKPMTADYGVAVRDHIVDMLYVDGKLAALIEMHPQADHLLIVNVAVSPDQQGRGYGRALLIHAEELAHSLGLSEMSLYTSSRLTENVKLYEQMGYKVDHEEEPSTHLGIFVYMSKPVHLAGGSPRKLGDEIALQRTENGGVTPVSGAGLHDIGRGLGVEPVRTDRALVR